MRYLHDILVFAAATLFASSVSVRAETDEKGFVRTRPEQLDWKIPFPGATPLALLEGDPSKPGIYVLRVQFPPNLFSRPHMADGTLTVHSWSAYCGIPDACEASRQGRRCPAYDPIRKWNLSSLITVPAE